LRISQHMRRTCGSGLAREGLQSSPKCALTDWH
jgi:hypothetical protein